MEYENLEGGGCGGECVVCSNLLNLLPRIHYCNLEMALFPVLRCEMPCKPTEVDALIHQYKVLACT